MDAKKLETINACVKELDAIVAFEDKTPHFTTEWRILRGRRNEIEDRLQYLSRPEDGPTDLVPGDIAVWRGGRFVLVVDVLARDLMLVNVVTAQYTVVTSKGTILQLSSSQLRKEL